MKLSTISASLALVVVMVSADKDTDYYAPGFTNPNIKHKMYWKDTYNVLQDLDQFHSLYVKYHGCVWTKYGSRYGSGKNYDVAQTDDNVGNAQAATNGCGGDGGEYFWYLGRTQCFRANVAFTLYGILKDDSSSHGGNYCNKNTYISSFFTRFGVEAFSGPLGLDISEANSYCTSENPEDEENMYIDDYHTGDDYLNDNMRFVNYAAFTSYGTGCSAGKFVTDSYQGAFCNGNEYIETLDTLDSFNEAIESLGCTQIYDSSSDGRELQNDDQTINYEELAPLKILSLSRVCSVIQYPEECPDPYGKLAMYTDALNSALKGTVITKSSSEVAMQSSSGIFFFVFGAILMCLACTTRRQTSRKPVSRNVMDKDNFESDSDGTPHNSETFEDEDQARGPVAPLKTLSDMSARAVDAVSSAALQAKMSFQEFAESEISPPPPATPPGSPARSVNGPVAPEGGGAAAADAPPAAAAAAKPIKKRPRLAALSQRLFPRKNKTAS